MASRLTDRQKKEIIADYVESGSYRATAKKFGISDNTVKKICAEDAQTAQKCAQKKEQNTADMIAFMESRKEKAQSVMDAILDRMGDSETLDHSSLRDMAIAFGTVVDKFITNPQKNELEWQKLEIELAKIESQLKDTAPEEQPQDNFMDALSDTAKEVWEENEE